MQNEMRDRHLVTDNPQSMTESMLNFAYAKNERVYLRYANGTEDIDLCEYVSQLTKGDCNLSADDVMQGSCIEGCDCEKAVIYALAVQAAELRERLKHCESLEERGLLQTLPCKAGDTVYCIEHKTIHECVVTLVKSLTYENKTMFFVEAECEIVNPFYSDGRKMKHGIMAVWEVEYGSWYRAFPTKEQAEQKLKEMRGGNADTV